jgi:dTDP-4-dehydrorhamnose reductase
MDPTFNIRLPINNPIISVKDLHAPFFRAIEFYVLGGNGFIGSVIMNTIQELGHSVYKTSVRLEQLNTLEQELELYKPKYVICSAGITGTPNISWCETHKTETIETNITYQMTLAHLCKKHNIHLTVIGSGVIFKNDRFYTEDDEGNFDGNFYGKCRIYLENMCKMYDNVLYARINYPISKYSSAKNLITKLISYSSIDNVHITLTYIDELIPYLIDMCKTGETGICNLVNDGAISLVDIMNIYTVQKGESHTKHVNTAANTKSTSLLTLGKLTKYKVQHVNDAVLDCITQYISHNNSNNNIYGKSHKKR